MNQYYYDPKTNTLHGPIDRMPPVWDYGFPPDGPSDSQLSSAESDFDDAWKSFNAYLQNIPSHPHTFTGESRVVPEDKIEWMYEEMDIYAKAGYKVIGCFKDGKLQHGRDHENGFAANYIKEGETYTIDHTEVGGWHTDVFLQEFPGISFNSVHFLSARRVATPKITGEPSIPAHIVDDMKLDSYYDGFKDGAKLTGEWKERPANKQIRHAATEYIQLPSHRQAIIWDKLGYNGSFSVNTTAQEENKNFIQWLKDNNKVVEFIALFPLSGEPDTQAPGYTSGSGEEEGDPFIQKHLAIIKTKMKQNQEIVSKSKELINKHIKRLYNDPGRASVQYFLERGTISGMFHEALTRMVIEAMPEPLTAQPDKPHRYEYSNISEYLECYGDYVLRGTWNLPADFIAVNPPPSPTPQQGEKEEIKMSGHVVTYSGFTPSNKNHVVIEVMGYENYFGNRIKQGCVVELLFTPDENHAQQPHSPAPPLTTDEDEADSFASLWHTAEQQKAARKGFLAGCQHERSQQQEELLQLRAWKAGAIQVMPDFQEIGKLIGVPLGQSVHDKIIPYLKAQQPVDAVAELQSLSNAPYCSEPNASIDYKEGYNDAIDLVREAARNALLSGSQASNQSDKQPDAYWLYDNWCGIWGKAHALNVSDFQKLMREQYFLTPKTQQP